MLGLFAGDWHSLSEITNITNIPKETLNDLKKCGTSINKQGMSYPKKFTEADKCWIVLHIRRDSKMYWLSLHQLIKDLQIDASEKQFAMPYMNSDIITKLLNVILF